MDYQTEFQEDTITWPLKRCVGMHWLIEYVGCNVEKLKSVNSIKEIFLRAAKRSNASIVNQYFHQFKPFGVTGVILIEESHFSLHTWPEYGFASVDIYTCGDEMDPHAALDSLYYDLEAEDIHCKIIKRGF